MLRLQGAPVLGQPKPEGDVARLLALGAFVAQRVPSPFAYGFALPLADCAHDGDDEATGGGTGVERFRYRDLCDFALLEEFQQSTQSFTLRVRRSSFAMMIACTSPLFTIPRSFC